MSNGAVVGNGANGQGSDASTPTATVIPSGFPAYRTYMVIGFVSLTVTYFAVIAAFERVLRPWLDLPPSAHEYCLSAESSKSSESSPCWRADLFSFEMTSGLALIWSAWIGFDAWHLSRRTVHTDSFTTPRGRLFGYLPAGHQLTAIGTTFQLFDLCVSLGIPEQRQLLFLCHHIMAATVSWMGLNNQYFHYYGVFFLGCSEISTAPLVFIDMAKFFPPVPGTMFATIVAICGPLFALSFSYYRVILWWKVSTQMFLDIFEVLKDGTAQKLRPGRNHVLYIMMTLNLLLGCLQLYWFSIILGEAGKILGFVKEEEGIGIGRGVTVTSASSNVGNDL